jgi:hypothetical protein
MQPEYREYIKIRISVIKSEVASFKREIRHCEKEIKKCERTLKRYREKLRKKTPCRHPHIAGLRRGNFVCNECGYLGRKSRRKEYRA